MSTAPPDCWESLCGAAIFCCKVPENKPFQWIYLVDDAWFHPQGIDLKGAETPLQPPIFDEPSLSPVPWNHAKEKLESKAQGMAAAHQGNREEEEEEIVGPGVKIEKPFNDAEIALLLGNLAVERGYGICFCSFEYFWTHYTDEINRPFNAVFFDINHAIRGVAACGNLDVRWKDELKATGLYPDKVIANPLLHGWLLHYAIKLGCKTHCRSVIDHSHILLISSNFSSKESTGDRSAAGQFGTVTLEIWNQLFSAKDGGKDTEEIAPDARMADFGFTPFQKVARSTDDKAEMLTKGFDFFDRSFSKQGGWKTIKVMYERDLEWAKENAKSDADPTRIHFEAWKHSNCRPFLLWTSWLRTDGKWLSDLKGAYDSVDPRSLPTVDLFVRIVKSSGIHWAKDLVVPNGFSGWALEFPRAPEIEIITRIIDFLSSLTPIPGVMVIKGDPSSGRRKDPEISLRVEEDTNRLILQISMPERGVSKLKEKLTNCENGGATEIASELTAMGLLGIAEDNSSVEIRIPLKS